MDICVHVGDRTYGSYDTEQYSIYATKDGSRRNIEIMFSHEYDAPFPFVSLSGGEGEQHGGSVRMDVDAAEWLAYALLNLCSEYDARKSFTLRFDADEMEYEATDSSNHMK